MLTRVYFIVNLSYFRLVFLKKNIPALFSHFLSHPSGMTEWYDDIPPSSPPPWSCVRAVSPGVCRSDANCVNFKHDIF